MQRNESNNEGKNESLSSSSTDPLADFGPVQQQHQLSASSSFTTPPPASSNTTTPSSTLASSTTATSTSVSSASASSTVLVANTRAMLRSPVSANDFDLVLVLGRGSVGSKILQVRHKGLNTYFAMKVMKKKLLVRAQRVEQVLYEREIFARLRHPFIVRLYWSFQSKERLYFVMTHAPGGDLFTYLRSREEISERDVALYAAELTLALRYLHSLGAAHRDIKPENILIRADGHVMLADFGLSRYIPPNGRCHSLSGTCEYLAPEMIIEQGHTFASDWWQLGIVIHELLTGSHPFFSSSLYATQQRILNEPPALHEDLSPEAVSLLTGLLDKNPKTRLGGKPGDIESHPLFAIHGIQFDRVLRKEYKPDFVPVPEAAMSSSSMGAGGDSTSSSSGGGGAGGGGGGGGGGQGVGSASSSSVSSMPASLFYGGAVLDGRHFDEQFTREFPVETPASCLGSGEMSLPEFSNFIYAAYLQQNAVAQVQSGSSLKRPIVVTHVSQTNQQQQQLQQQLQQQHQQQHDQQQQQQAPGYNIVPRPPTTYTSAGTSARRR